MKELIGKRIFSYRLEAAKGQSFRDEEDEANARIVFVTDQGDVSYRAKADCCSHTWFEKIEEDYLFDKQYGSLVIAVEDLDWQPCVKNEGLDYLQIYGVKITTEKGIAIVEFRNSSNGYYGGSYQYEGVTNAV